MAQVILLVPTVHTHTYIRHPLPPLGSEEVPRSHLSAPSAPGTGDHSHILRQHPTATLVMRRRQKVAVATLYMELRSSSPTDQIYVIKTLHSALLINSNLLILALFI
jgi:hypothetical protein